MDNSKAVDALTESKGLADKVMVKQKAAVVTERRIDRARQAYASMSQVGASLFFSVADVGSRASLCQWPLEWLEERLLAALQITRDQESKARRLREEAERMARRLARGRSLAESEDGEPEYDSEEEYAREHAGPPEGQLGDDMYFDSESVEDAVDPDGTLRGRLEEAGGLAIEAVNRIVTRALPQEGRMSFTFLMSLRLVHLQDPQMLPDSVLAYLLAGVVPPCAHQALEDLSGIDLGEYTVTTRQALEFLQRAGDARQAGAAAGGSASSSSSGVGDESPPVDRRVGDHEARGPKVRTIGAPPTAGRRPAANAPVTAADKPVWLTQ